MDTTVYVVYRYSDNRKENNASIIAACKTKQKALEIMKNAIDEYACENDGEIENFEDGTNVICCGDYEVFVMKETSLLS